MKPRLYKIFTFSAIGAFGIFAGAALAVAATTIGTDINTGGNLIVTGTSALTGTTTATSIQLTSSSNISSLLVGNDLTTGAQADTVRGMVQFTGDFGAAPPADLKQGETLHAAGYWTGDQTADQYTNAVDVDATLGVSATSNFLSAVNAYVENDETTLTTPWIAALYANGSYAAGPNTTNAAGLYVQPQRFLGTQALNTYGVYIDDDGGSHGTNDWGLYVAGTQKKSYFAGTVGIGTPTPYSKFQVTSGANATTTVNFGEVGVSTSHACFNTKNTAGADISFYFVGTSMVVENHLCQ